MQLLVDCYCQACLLCVQVLRLEPHCVISNRTGTPLQIMHLNTGNKVQRLGGKATGVQPSRGQQPQMAPPGLKGVVANPSRTGPHALMYLQVCCAANLTACMCADATDCSQRTSFGKELTLLSSAL